MSYTIKQMSIGVSGFPVQIVLIDTDNTIDEVLTTGYLGSSNNASGVILTNKQAAVVYTTDGGIGNYQVSVSSGGVASLVANTDGFVNLPVVSGDFAVFDGTTGVIKDAGFSPSDATKTKVAMKGTGTVAAGYMAKFADEFGTINAPDGDAVNIGNIIAGNNGTAGKFISTAPTGLKGTMTFEAQDNAAAYSVAVRNRSHAQSSTRYIPDIGASADFLLTALASPDANINLVRFDASVGTTALASGAVTLFAGSGTKQYKIVALWLNFGANLAVGDKNLAISDGTTTYSVIPTLSLLTLVNATWGSVALPFPTAAALNTSTAAGASLTATYSGGTTNYTGGATIVISGILQRVA